MQALGESEAFLAFQERLRRVAEVERPVLVVGERGTGKELAARRLHYLSKRWQGPLVTLNCAALNPNLIESELFGHEPGAFTGAAKTRTGRFEAAHGGTLFLDEIGAIPMVAQEKILRAVEYGTFERVGSSRARSVDVRVVGATNADLRELAAAGRFMPDLLDRLCFEVLRLPPLRERGEDILLLARHFCARMAHELGLRDPPAFSEEAEAGLLAHAWPGNVRELKNVVERAVYLAGEGEIGELVFDPFARAGIGGGRSPAPAGELTEAVGTDMGPGMDFQQAMADREVELLGRALRRARYNQRRAAEILGLTYHKFRGLYRKYRPRLEARDRE